LNKAERPELAGCTHSGTPHQRGFLFLGMTDYGRRTKPLAERFSPSPRFCPSAFDLQIGHWPAQVIRNAEKKSVIRARQIERADQFFVVCSVSTIRSRASKPL